MSVNGSVIFTCKNCSKSFEIEKNNLYDRGTIECPNCQNQFFESEKLEKILSSADNLFDFMVENDPDWKLSITLEN